MLRRAAGLERGVNGTFELQVEAQVFDSTCKVPMELARSPDPSSY